MRALHVHSGNLYGGVESLLVALVAHSADSDLRSEFALAFDGALADALRRHGAAVHSLGPVRLSRPWTLRRARRRLAALMRERRPDLVLCHSRWSQIVAGNLPRVARLPIAIWLHAAPTGRHWQERWAARHPVRCAICNSEWTASAARLCDPALRTAVVRPPVPAPPPIHGAARRAVRERHGAKDDTVVILQVGRIEAGKGLVEHVRAAGRLPTTPPWALWIVGAPQRRAERRHFDAVMRAAREAGIADRVVAVGETRDVAPLYAAADIYCQPNVRPESFGITFVEALYAGLPVVTTDLGAAKEIVTSDCGILVPPGGADALAATLRRLAADSTARSTLGGAGPARADTLCNPARPVRAFADAVRAAVAFPP